MVEKIIGFLTLKGWKGVEDIYTFVAIGVLIGMGLVYYFLVYQKEYKPSRLTVAQSYILKIFILVIALVLIFTLT